MGARSDLLEGFDHLLTSLPTRLQHRQEDGKEDGEYPRGKKAGDSTELRSRAGIDSPGWVPAVVKNDGQASGTQRGQGWNHQPQRHHHNGDQGGHRTYSKSPRPFDPAEKGRDATNPRAFSRVQRQNWVAI